MRWIKNLKNNVLIKTIKLINGKKYVPKDVEKNSKIKIDKKEQVECKNVKADNFFIDQKKIISEDVQQSTAIINTYKYKNIDIFSPLLEILYSKYNHLIQPFEYELCHTLSLIDKYCNCPSVVIHKEDIDSSEYKQEIFELLTNVKLAEHLVNTATEIIKIVASKYSNWEKAILMYVFSALYHDIGKSKHICGKSWVKKNHIELSIKMAKNMFFGIKECFWLNDVIFSISKHHHKISTPKQSTILRYADASARHKEICKLKSIIKKENNNWFDVKDFIEKILLPLLNSKEKNSLIVFTYKNNLYINKNKIYDLVYEYMTRKNVYDDLFIRKSDIFNAKNYIIDQLYKQKLVNPNTEIEKKSKIIIQGKYPIIISTLKIPLDTYDYTYLRDLIKNKKDLEIITKIINRGKKNQNDF